MAQLNEIIDQAQAIIACADKLRTTEKREDAVELHRLCAEISTMALKVVLNTI